ncbi:N(4)-acetylcytidine aminohydrolase [Shewanella sp. SR44-3]|uniref:N(4)-acetylcytidine aminohydrolase n=1 Tax=unclassified Shewanella TaxID=196818 RepID=UPI0015FC56F0|nr:N(4)-acetylcytidine aminohydrolase [Shewanella sp. SR44-3]MBB1271051.1 ASCH domain-containing protein [Shewanella sp. SR44-3]
MNQPLNSKTTKVNTPKNSTSSTSAPQTSISFFERFEADILSQRKTITLREASDAKVYPGQIIPVYTFESQRWFCDIQIISCQAVQFDALNSAHAKQENMPLAELKDLIQVIYPGISELFEIKFTLKTK